MSWKSRPHKSFISTQETYPTIPTKIKGMTRDTHRLVALLIDAFGAIDEQVDGPSIGPQSSTAHATIISRRTIK